MDGVGTPIIGRPRPLPSHDTPNPAHNTYTLKCEEPNYGVAAKDWCQQFLHLLSLQILCHRRSNLGRIGLAWRS